MCCGQFTISSEGVGQVSADLHHHRHQDVREGGQEARRVEAVVEHFSQEHWQTGQQGVEAPVLGEMRDDDGPDWFAGQHGPPRRRRVRDLSVRQTDGVLEILQLLLRDLPVLIRRVLDTEPP